MAQKFFTKDVRSSAVLTDTYVAGTVVDTRIDAVEQEYATQMIATFSITKGSLTSIEYKFEFSNDGVTYGQETTGSVSGGTISDILAEHSILASTAPTSGVYDIPVPIGKRYVKISVKGTGTMTGSLMAVQAHLLIA